MLQKEEIRMALDYRRCAQEIVSHTGGIGNIVQTAHCATRLRLSVKDKTKIDMDALDRTEGVQGIFESDGQLQIIIGTGTVNKVYDELTALTGTGVQDADIRTGGAETALWRRLLKPVGDVFVPILPAVVASGILMGTVNLLGSLFPGFAAGDWYAFLNMVSHAVFVFLPGIAAVSAARVFGGNIYLGGLIGLLMILPSLQSSADVNIPAVAVQTGYQGHVLPVIIAVFLMCQIEKRLHRHVPEILDIFLTPALTLLITSVLAFTVIGPLTALLETWLVAFARILVKNPAGACALGALYPWTVLMGVHHMFNVIEAGMIGSTGLNTIMPIASAANFAQFGACLAVGLRTANKKTKAAALPAAVSASLGITEPAIFGVNMRLSVPFLAAVAGGAAGAAVGSFGGLGASAFEVTGIPGYLIINKPLLYTALLAVSGITAFVLTNIFWKDSNAPAEEESAPKETAMRTEKGIVRMPVRGELIPSCEIRDPLFAEEAMGPGVGIVPSGDTVYAPFDGTVVMVYPTGHAIGLESDTGMQVLIHIGIDTVRMNGAGFEVYVSQGDTVKAGDKLVHFDRKRIAEAGYDDTVVVVLTNSADFTEIERKQ